MATIGEASDIATVLQHLTGSAEKDPVDVTLAARRLAERAGKALQVTPDAIATVADLEEAVADLAQHHADTLDDWREVVEVPTGGLL
jgi:hypothetical protein